jgi:hypothetical protein
VLTVNTIQTEIVTETAQRKSSSRANDGPELSTDGAVSLFSTVLTNALEQQKINIMQHFESRFAKNEKQTGVEAGDFVPTAVSVELAKATKKIPSIELCSTA